MKSCILRFHLEHTSNQLLVPNTMGWLTFEPFLLCFAGSISTKPVCHCGTNMTEVAQVAAGVAHDMDDITNEDEYNMSDAENRDDDVTDENDENEAPKESCRTNDEAGGKRRTNGVTHKDPVSKKDRRSKAVNGIAEDAKTNADEEQNSSDLALKKEVSDKCMSIDKVSSVLSFTETIYTRFTRNRNSSDPESRWPEATCQS